MKNKLAARIVAIEAILAEREKQIDQRLQAANEAMAAAIASREKISSVSLAASEKAIDKAEQAQREYNVHANEFRAQLDDQAKTLMPRNESNVLIGGLETKINDLQSAWEIRAENLKMSSDDRIEQLSKQIAAINLTLQTTLSISSFDIRHAELQKQVNDLRESRSMGQGHDQQANARGVSDRWALGIAAGLILGLVELGLRLVGK